MDRDDDNEDKRTNERATMKWVINQKIKLFIFFFNFKIDKKRERETKIKLLYLVFFFAYIHIFFCCCFVVVNGASHISIDIYYYFLSNHDEKECGLFSLYLFNLKWMAYILSILIYLYDEFIMEGFFCPEIYTNKRV